MNILYLTEFLSAIAGGGGSGFFSYALAMGARGHHVHVVCHKSRNDSIILPNSHVEVHKIDPEANFTHGSFPSIASRFLYVIRMVIESIRIIKNERIDIIHANTLDPTIAGAILGSIFKIPVVNTVHHVQGVQLNGCRSISGLHIQNANSIVAVLRCQGRKLYEKIIINLPAERIHSVSRATCDDLRRFGYRGKIEIVPNGLELEKFDDSSSAIEYLPYILSIGRLVDYKNLDTVIEAFAPISERLTNAKLIILGDGPMRHHWEQKAVSLGIQTKVEFKGFVNEDEKIKLLSKCSALVFPSLVEGFGMVILEAFALSKPVIVSDIESLRELVEDGVNGFVLPPSQVEQWTAKMSKILTDQSIVRAMGREGRKRIESYYSMNRVSRMMESLYQEVHSNRILEKEQIAT